MLSNPLCRSIARVGRRRKFVFRGQRIVHGDDDTPGPIGQDTAEAIMGIQITKHKATAMKEDQKRERATSFWGIDSDRNSSSHAINHAIFEVRNGLRDAKLSNLPSHALAYLRRSEG